MRGQKAGRPACGPAAQRTMDGCAVGRQSHEVAPNPQVSG